jgi:hypothetical protein
MSIIATLRWLWDNYQHLLASSMLKQFLISLLKKLFSPPTLLMDQVLFVLAKYSECYGLQINDLIEQEFSKRPGMGMLYVALHHLEREGRIESRWSEETYAERGGARRRYYRLAERVSWEEAKLHLE